MLPFPVSHNQKRVSHKLVRGNSWRSIRLDVLLSRSRLTNLTVLVLTACFIASLLFNIHFWLVPESSYDLTLSPSRSVVVPRSIRDTVSVEPELVKSKHLIIVAGHGIWKGCLPEERVDEHNWALGPEAQNKGASVKVFFSHIMRGYEPFARLFHSTPSLLLYSVEAVLDDPEAVLIFSGYVSSRRCRTARVTFRVPAGKQMLMNPSPRANRTIDWRKNLMSSTLHPKDFRAHSQRTTQWTHSKTSYFPLPASVR